MFEHVDFVEAVRNMRDHQRRYFQTRTQEALQSSKNAERKVDAMLIQHQEKANGQTEMF